jgi:hypothetical protein
MTPHACRVTVRFHEIFRFLKNIRKFFGSRETKFRDDSRKVARFRMIFVFSRKFKNAFSFQPNSWEVGTVQLLKSSC